MNAAGRWVADNPWKVIALTIVATIAFGIFIPGIDMVTEFRDYLSPSNDAVKATREAEDKYGSAAYVQVSIKPEGEIFDREVLGRIRGLREEISGLKGVKSVEGPLNSQVIVGEEKSIIVGPAAPGGNVPEDETAMEEFKEKLLESKLLLNRVVSETGDAAALSVEFNTDVSTKELAGEIREIVKDYEGPEEIELAGEPYFNSAFSQAITDDLKILLPLVFLAIALVLYVTFRSPRGVFLPLLVVALSITWTVGLMSITGIPFTMVSFILPVILAAVGSAYSIHVLNKYYELTEDDRSEKETIVETISAMFSPVTMTGLTTGAGFLSLISAFLIPERQFGIFAAVGVAIAVILSLTLVPAVLALLPFQQKRELPGFLSFTAGLSDSFVGFFTRTVVKRKKVVVALFIVVLFVFVAGAFTMQLNTSYTAIIGRNSSITDGMESMDQNFAGSQQLLVEIDTGRSDGLKDPEVLKKMDEFQDWLKTKDGLTINKTASIVEIVKELNQKFHEGDEDYYRVPDDQGLTSQLLLLFSFQGGSLGRLAMGDFSAGEITGLYDQAKSARTNELVAEIEEYLDDNFPEVEARMVGSTRVMEEMSNKVVSSQVISLVTSILVAGFIVGLIMWSPTAGILSLIPLVSAVLINFGIMGFSGIPLNIVNLIVSSIMIGIGIDYAIHLLERFQVEYEGSRDDGEIFSTVLRTTGKGILANALALALGFAVIGFSSFSSISTVGLLLAMAMIVSMASTFTAIPAVLFLLKPKALTGGNEGETGEI
ncbi:RND family transporter [Candidatus Bipolaricaulota bacterium]|nr:RND family transporter [Candidatus Bipolaricaulota bacterium]